MGLFELLLGKDNPATKWAGDNRGYLTGLSTSLLSDGMNFAPAQQGAALDQQAAQQRDADAKLATQTNATKQWLNQNYPDLAQAVDAGLPVSEAWQQAFSRQNQKAGGNEYQDRFAAGQQYGLTGDALNTFALSGSVPGTNKQNVTYGTTPVWGQDSTTGKMGYGVTGSDGSFKIVDTGGFQPMGPGEVAGARASGTLFGKDTTQAALDLPTAIDRGTQAINLIDQLMPQVRDPNTGQMVDNQGFNEQFGQFVGVPVGQMTPAMPNTPKADFQSNLDQVKAQGFLQGIEQMKGTGAISEAEGSKATDAVINARTSTTKDGFVRNMNIAKDIIKAGIDRLKRKAAQSSYSIPPATGGNQTSSGVSWSVEP